MRCLYMRVYVYFGVCTEALNKQHDAMSQALKLADRNEELEKELRDIDHIALAVEADCNSAVKENNKRVSKLQVLILEVDYAKVSFERIKYL